MPQQVVTPNEFTGTDSERINQAVLAAARGDGHVVIPRINRCGGSATSLWLLDSAILLPANITVELDNCVIQLSDRCRDNFFRSANCGQGISVIEPLANIHIRGIGTAVLQGARHPRATGDSAKTLGERTFGTDAGVDGESQTGDWRNIGILLASVSQFSIENVSLRDSHCWAISLEYCDNGRIRDIHFDSHPKMQIDGEDRTYLNQDGLDLRQGCHDIIIENITGNSGDDLVALTAIPHARPQAGRLGSTMVSAHLPTEGIWNIIIRNVKGYSAGGHHIVRLLNTLDMRIHDVLIDGLIDTSGEDGVRCRAALKIGDHNPRWGGVTPLGNTCRIIANNIVSRAKDSILIGGSLAESSLSNVMHYGADGEAISLQSGPEYVRDLQTSNIRKANSST